MKIVWTNQARHTYDLTIAYLMEKWTVKSAQNFVDSVSLMEKQLKNFPNSFSISNKKLYLRKAVLNKHSSVIYEVDGENIVLITFLSNVQDHEY